MNIEESFDFEFKIEKENKVFIYFLFNNESLVYIGKTINGFSRPFSHYDKIFNKIKVIFCKKDELDLLETKYICKYKPQYNRAIYEYISLENIKEKKLKPMRIKTTCSELSKLMKELDIEILNYNGKCVIKKEFLYKIIEYANNFIKNNKQKNYGTKKNV